MRLGLPIPRRDGSRYSMRLGWRLGVRDSKRHFVGSRVLCYISNQEIEYMENKLYSTKKGIAVRANVEALFTESIRLAKYSIPTRHPIHR